MANITAADNTPIRALFTDQVTNLDALAREQDLHHLDMTLMRRHYQRRGPVRRALVDFDALAREQEPHHLGQPEVRRPVKRRSRGS